jgi:hypothetical protein
MKVGFLFLQQAENLLSVLLKKQTMIATKKNGNNGRGISLPKMNNVHTPHR